MKLYRLVAISCFPEENKELGIFSSYEKARLYFKLWKTEYDSNDYINHTDYDPSIQEEELDPEFE